MIQQSIADEKKIFHFSKLIDYASPFSCNWRLHTSETVFVTGTESSSFFLYKRVRIVLPLRRFGNEKRKKVGDKGDDENKLEIVTKKTWDEIQRGYKERYHTKRNTILQWWSKTDKRITHVNGTSDKTQNSSKKKEEGRSFSQIANFPLQLVWQQIRF